LNSVTSDLLGKAAGTLNTMQQFGAVFGVAIVTAVFNSRGGLATPTAVTSGYRPALATAAALSALGSLTALGLSGRVRSTVANRRSVGGVSAGASDPLPMSFAPK
jgi:hypothetical protein